MVPKACKYCGCEEIAETFAEFVYFRCGTTYWPESDMWTGAGKCVGRCAERLRELRERVQRAVEVLDDITSDAWEESVDDEEVSYVVDSQIVAHAIEILEGKRNGTE